MVSSHVDQVIVDQKTQTCLVIVTMNGTDLRGYMVYIYIKMSKIKSKAFSESIQVTEGKR